VGEMRWQHPGLCPIWSLWSDPSYLKATTS